MFDAPPLLGGEGGASHWDPKAPIARTLGFGRNEGKAPKAPGLQMSANGFEGVDFVVVVLHIFTLLQLSQPCQAVICE